MISERADGAENGQSGLKLSVLLECRVGAARVRLHQIEPEVRLRDSVNRPVRRLRDARLVLAEVHPIPVVPERSTEVIQYRPGFMTEGAADAILSRERRYRRGRMWKRHNHG